MESEDEELNQHQDQVEPEHDHHEGGAVVEMLRTCEHQHLVDFEARGNVVVVPGEDTPTPAPEGTGYGSCQ